MEKTWEYLEATPTTEEENERKFSERALDHFRISAMWMLALYVYCKKQLLPIFCPSSCHTTIIRGKEVTVPLINTWWVDGISQRCQEIRRGAGRWSALNIILRYRKMPAQTFANCIDNFWLHIRNARAVRNRNYIMSEELTNAIYRSFNAHGQARILSVAYGSFEAVLTAVKKVKLESPGTPISVVYIDIDNGALKQVELRAKEEGLEKLIETRRILFIKRNSFRALLQEFKPTIIEMGGLFDHLESQQIHTIVGEAYDALPSLGYFITAHIHSNIEKFFMEKVLEWVMIYRDREEFAHLVTHGLAWKPVTFLTEKEGVHSIITCVK